MTQSVSKSLCWASAHQATWNTLTRFSYALAARALITCAVVAWASVALPRAMAVQEARPTSRSLATTLEEVQPKVVKIHGAGGFRGLEAYQSGMLVSPDGHVLTAFSYVLDTDVITVTLNDGRRFDAALLGANPRLEVAVLKIEATDLSHFDLADAVAVDGGTRILALSNLFGVATGNEAASVQHGVVSVRTTLAARRGVFETPYHGPIYLLDAVTNNPGAAGGAVVTRRGLLIGMLGKELRNARNRTWLNYAVPIAELRASVERLREGHSPTPDGTAPDGTAPDGTASDSTTRRKPQRPLQLASLGIVLVPDLLERTPPYIDAIRARSPAARAGLRPDDLILLLDEKLIQSCRSLREGLAWIDFEDSIRLGVMRGSELLEISLQTTPFNEGKTP